MNEVSLGKCYYKFEDYILPTLKLNSNFAEFEKSVCLLSGKAIDPTPSMGF